MIVRFSFSNFKSIKEEVTLSFEASKSTELEEFYVVRATPKLRLLKVAAIYGANASGKSNVLEALEFLRQLVVGANRTKDQPINISPFAFHEPGAPQTPSTFRLKCVISGTLYEYEVTLNKRIITSERLVFYAPNKAVVFDRTTNPKSGISTITLGSKISLPAEEKRNLEINTLPNITTLGGYLRTNLSFPEVGIVVSWFINQLTFMVNPTSNLYPWVSNLIQSGQIEKEQLLRFLRKADFNIVDLAIEDDIVELDEASIHALKESNPQLLDYLNDKQGAKHVYEGKKMVFYHQVEGNGTEKKYPLDYVLQSMGTKRYYELAGLLTYVLSNSRVMPIDEIESSLHPDLLKHFLLLFLRNSKNSQLIFTTHQRDLMRETDMLRNDIFHFTEKRPDGSTDLYSFTEFDSSVVRSDSSLYNAYKIGKLGAVPELGDAYIPVE